MQQHAPRTALVCAPLLFALALAAVPARAELIEVRWDADGRFVHSAALEPGKFAELCTRLNKGQTVAWSFKSAAPTNFNIHYHEGKKVEFPAKVDGALGAEGRLAVALTQDYCWMWSNKTDAPSALSVTLQR